MTEPSKGAANNGNDSAQPGSIRMIVSLVGIAAFSGILIVSVYQWTLPTIKANKAIALRKSVFEVLPHTERLITFRLDADGKLVPLAGEDEKAVKFYAGYTADNQLSGVAMEAKGQGFQDVIKVIYGYSPRVKNVVGMRVLESKETPGLGDKIGIDPAFLANFTDLDVRLAEGGAKLLHPIEVVKKGRRVEKWQIDSITGATISSKAIGKLLNRSAAARIPIVEQNLERLERGEKGE